MPLKSEIHAKPVIFSLILMYLMEYLSAENIYTQGPPPQGFELSPVFKFKTTYNSIKSFQRPRLIPVGLLSQGYLKQRTDFSFSVCIWGKEIEFRVMC